MVPADRTSQRGDIAGIIQLQEDFWLFALIEKLLHLRVYAEIGDIPCAAGVNYG
jgi:hypothetical protein